MRINTLYNLVNYRHVFLGKRFTGAMFVVMAVLACMVSSGASAFDFHAILSDTFAHNDMLRMIQQSVHEKEDTLTLKRMYWLPVAGVRLSGRGDNFTDMVGQKNYALSAKLFDTGIVYSIEAAQLSLQLAKLRQKKAKESVFFSLLTTILSIHIDKKIVQLRQDALSARRHTYDRSAQLFENGLIAEGDLQNAEAGMYDAEYQLETARVSLSDNQHLYRDLVGEEFSLDVDIDDLEFFDSLRPKVLFEDLSLEISEVTRQSALDMVKTEGIDVRIQELTTKISDVSVLHALWNNKVSLTARIDAFSPTAVDKWSYSASVSLGVQLPLASVGALHIYKDHLLKRVQYNNASKVQKIAREFSSAWRKVASYKARIRHLETLVKVQQSHLNKVQIMFERKQKGVQEQLDASNKLLSSQKNLLLVKRGDLLNTYRILNYMSLINFS